MNRTVVRFFCYYYFMVDNLKQSIHEALNQELYYAALVSSLCIPDICGYLDNPENGSGKRYANWFTAYMPSYLSVLPAEEAYALRCIVLHDGGLSTESYKLGKPKSSLILDKYVLTINNTSNLTRFTGCTYNGAIIPNLVVLDAPTYCRDLLAGIARWEKDKGRSLEEYDGMLTLHDGMLDLGFATIS